MDCVKVTRREMGQNHFLCFSNNPVGGAKYLLTSMCTFVKMKTDFIVTKVARML